MSTRLFVRVGSFPFRKNAVADPNYWDRHKGLTGGNEDVEMTDMMPSAPLRWRAGDTVRITTRDPARWLSYGVALQDSSYPTVSVRHIWPPGPGHEEVGNRRWAVERYPSDQLVKSDGPPPGAEFGPDVYSKPVTSNSIMAMRAPAVAPNLLSGRGGTGESSYHEAAPPDRDAGTGASTSRSLRVGDHVWCRPFAQSAAQVRAVVAYVYSDGTAAVTFPESVDPIRRERFPLTQLAPLTARRAAFDR